MLVLTIIVTKNVDYRFKNHEIEIIKKFFELNRFFNNLNLINIFDFINK